MKRDIETELMDDRRISVRELCRLFGLSLGAVHKIVTNGLGLEKCLPDRSHEYFRTTIKRCTFKSYLNVSIFNVTLLAHRYSTKTRQRFNIVYSGEDTQIGLISSSASARYVTDLVNLVNLVILGSENIYPEAC